MLHPFYIRKFRSLLLPVLGMVIPYGQAHGGAWSLPKGHFWTKITVMRQAADEEYTATGGGGRGDDPARFFQPGDRAPYRFDGRYSSVGVFLDLRYGLTDWIEIGAQLPYFDQNFSDTQDPFFLEDRGQRTLSDMRATMKVRLASNLVVFSLKAATKAPTGKFRNRDGLITVAEGQWDIDIIGQIGRSLWPIPAYANLDVGYRVRFKNSEVDRDPGDEWTFNAEAGVNVHPKVMTILKLEGIRGGSSTNIGLRIPSDVRRITYLSPSVMFGPFANLNLETGVRITLNGRNFPAGKMFVVGLSYAGKLF